MLKLISFSTVKMNQGGIIKTCGFLISSCKSFPYQKLYAMFFFLLLLFFFGGWGVGGCLNSAIAKCYFALQTINIQACGVNDGIFLL